MKRIFFLACFVCTTTFLHAQKPATNKNIKTLLQLTGAGELGNQVMSSMMDSYKKAMPEIPNEFWDEFKKEVGPVELVEMIIPVYAKYYSDEDIRQLIEFYNTPVGKKVVRVTPMVVKESMEIGGQMGERIGLEIARKLKEKGYTKDENR